MPLDYNILNQQKTVLDQQALQQAFEQKKALQLAQLAAYAAKANPQANIPADIQVAQYYAGLDDAGRDLFDRSQRAPVIKDTGTGYNIYSNGGLNPIPGGQKSAAPKVVDMGGGFGVTNPNNTITPIGNKTLTPKDQIEEVLNQRAQQDLFNRGVKVQEKALEAVDRLLANPDGVRANRGGVSTLFKNVSSGSIDAAADLETLTSLLTTDNLGLLKGVLSDSDLRLLQNISAGELQGSDEKTLQALERMRKALSNKVVNARSYDGTGLPPVLSAIDQADPILTPQPTNGRRVVKWDDL